MVNYGVSRGCSECKKRHKKCDETRPACIRCRKFGRVCSGFLPEASLVFRHWSAPCQPSYAPSIFQALHDVQDEIQQDSALRLFVDEFVVVATDPSLSRGFLDGMQHMLRRVHPASALACTARILVLACIGHRTGKRSLVSKTQRQYIDILQIYSRSLSAQSTHVPVEDLYTAVLLGLYEIIVGGDESTTQCMTHARGICAILSSSSSPFDLTSGPHMFQLNNPLRLRQPIKGNAVLYLPAGNGNVQSLDSTLLKFQDFFHRAGICCTKNCLSIEECHSLLEEGTALDDEFERWGKLPGHVGAPYTYKTITVMDESAATSSRPAYFYPGRVDYYFDYYMAAVWNTFRKSHVQLLDMIVHLAKRTSQERMVSNIIERCGIIVADVIASIPYHLALNVHDYARLVKTTAAFIPPNRPIGGLLLLHPLYTCAKCEIVPHHIRLYLSRCLAWIAEYVGIGQARLLAKSINERMDEAHPLSDPLFPFQTVSEGHILVWAGMLLRPTCLDSLPVKQA
ncbi:hypothetical protein F5884DRAFT_876054 [Xylogone sp. PMI_703]|nr:hypothetical protein F5884DRAFT_876054 [Xylogone sp. PMI_703]